MPASKQLVHIPRINEHTWLLMSKLEQGTCLRDYSKSTVEEIRDYSTDDLESELKKDECYSEKLPSFSKISYEDEEFWREQIDLRNCETGLIEFDKRRLQDNFKKQCRSAMEQKSEATLSSVFQRWIKRFECVKDKDQFNHWDNDSPKNLVSSDKGIGWTSQLLEASRHNHEVQYISTGCDATEFSLVAMELGLSVSSKNNLFNPGKRDIIIPDGLALRSSGYFTVIEVKGPKDERSLIDPMLQATCGTLAVFAKKEMLREIALKHGDLRPAFHRAEIPKQSRSLGIHILTSADKNGEPREPWTEDVADSCTSVIKAFPQLKYIAYSFVSAEEANNLASIKTDYLITINGVTKP